jgi:hypothetical protein
MKKGKFKKDFVVAIGGRGFESRGGGVQTRSGPVEMKLSRTWLIKNFDPRILWICQSHDPKLTHSLLRLKVLPYPLSFKVRGKLCRD